MPVAKLELPEEAPTVQFHVRGLIPAGYASVLFAPAGVGKTRLVSYLAVQTVRSSGDFVGQAVRSGRVLILDADDPSGTGYAQWLNRFFQAYPHADRSRIDHRAVTDGLTRDDVLALIEELKGNPPALIVVDTFASSFIGVDVLKPHTVSGPMGALALLAHKTGAAVILLDHVGKLAPGQTVAEKGAMGTAAKMALPRAAFALDRLPPKECEGRDVVRLTCVKQSYAAQPDPIGLEFVWDEYEGVSVEPFALPGEGRGAVTARAEKTMRLLIAAAGEEGISRSELLAQTVGAANVGKRTAAEVFAQLQGLAEEYKAEVRPGRGSPLVITALPKPSSVHQEPDALVSIDLASNTLEPVSDGVLFRTPPFASNQGLHQIEEGTLPVPKAHLNGVAAVAAVEWGEE